MELSWVGSMVSSFPPQLQTVVVLVVLWLGHRIVDAKWLSKRNGNGDVGKRLAEIEAHVTNHLTTMSELEESVVGLTTAIRDMQEESSRVARSMNIMLNKQDELDKTLDTLDKSMIRIEERMR